MANTLITESGPWTGQWSARELGDIPPGGSPLQSNVVNVSGAAMALRSRRGLECKVHEDRVPADAWVAGSSYAVGDRVWYNNTVYRCITANSDGTFTASKWVEDKCVGILASPSFGLGLLFQVQRTNDAMDGNQTLMAGSFVPAYVMTQPEGFVPPETINPIVPGAVAEPEYAYLITKGPGAGVALKLFQVNINARNTAGATSRLTASATLTAAQEQNVWLIKGADLRAYWLAWRGVKGQSTGAAHLTRFGAWDGASLDENSWNPRYRASGVENDFETDDVPVCLGMRPTGELVLIGENDRDANPKPTKPAGSKGASNISWRFQPSAIPDNLLASDGARSSIRPDSDQENTGAVHLIGLPDGDLLWASTTKASTGKIKTRRIRWSGDVPSVVSAESFSHTTSQTVSNGRTSFIHGNLLALVDGGTYAVARGTNGFTIRSLGGSHSIDVDPGSASAVLGRRAGGQVIVFDDAADKLFVYDKLGTLQTTYTTGEYAVLGKAFRGMFMDAEEKTLYFVSYDSGASAGSRVKITGVHMGYDAWVTGTAYEIGQFVTTGSPPVLYECLEAHTAGTFATDLGAGKWVARTAEYTLDMSSHTDVESSVYAFPDSAGSVFRNITAAAA